MSRQAELLAAAAKLFSERGYHGTTVRDLADALHVQSGSLYAHISSKEDLLWRIVQEVDQLIVACTEAVSQELPAEEQVKQLVQSHLALIEEARPYITVYLRDWELLSSERKEESRTARRVYKNRLQQVIEAGVAQGVFWVEDARLATIFAITTVNMIFQWFRSEGPLSLEEISEQYITYILRALGSVGELADRYKDLIQRATKEKESL
jgi:TetR/AcrR family transcriptional regulator, cholesterol catabolism regulator